MYASLSPVKLDSALGLVLFTSSSFYVCLSEFMCTTCVQNRWRPQVGSKSPGFETTDDGEPTLGDRTQTWVLCKRSKLLTAESLFQFLL